MLRCCRSLPIKVLKTKSRAYLATHSFSCQLLHNKPHFTTGTVRQRRVATRATGEQAQAPESYRSIAAPHSVTVEVKKSKFITTAWPTSSPDEALQLVADAADPGASHNCWAYRIGESFRSNDDGEPGGTAGAPILKAIEGEGLDGVCVLVTRHFGGTKLGAGGLVRAYGSATRECLRAAEHTTVQPLQQLRLELPMTDIGIAYGQLDKFGAKRLEEVYSEDGQSVALDVRLPAAEAPQLQAALADASSGRIECS